MSLPTFMLQLQGDFSYLFTLYYICLVKRLLLIEIYIKFIDIDNIELPTLNRQTIMRCIIHKTIM